VLNSVDPSLKNLHPRYQLREIFDLVGRIGAHKFLYGAGYNRERDLLIGCMFAFYSRRIQSREWFIQRISDPPDFSLTAAADRPFRERPFDHTEIEIVQISPHVSNYSGVIKTLVSTKLDISYSRAVDKDTVLLIFINNSNGPHWSDLLEKFFRDSEDAFGQVFAIYLLVGNPNEPFVYEVKSLRPGGSKEVLKLTEEVNSPLIWHPYFEKFAAKVEQA